MRVPPGRLAGVFRLGRIRSRRTDGGTFSAHSPASFMLDMRYYGEAKDV
jgi:hypothetical protein